MYYSATIFHLLAFASPTLTALLIALTNFLATLVAFATIDRIGRRRMLLLSIPIMALGLAICAIGFHYLHLDLGNHLLLNNNDNQKPTPPPSTPLTLLILASLTLYVAAYALGLGTIPWLQSELFPLSVRALGSGLATSVNWSCNTLVGLTFLPLMEALGPGVTFAGYAGVCGAGFVAVWVGYREVAGLGLESVGGVWGGE